MGRSEAWLERSQCIAHRILNLICSQIIIFALHPFEGLTIELHSRLSIYSVKSKPSTFISNHNFIIFINITSTKYCGSGTEHTQRANDVTRTRWTSGKPADAAAAVQRAAGRRHGPSWKYDVTSEIRFRQSTHEEKSCQISSRSDLKRRSLLNDLVISTQWPSISTNLYSWTIG